MMVGSFDTGRRLHNLHTTESAANALAAANSAAAALVSENAAETSETGAATSAATATTKASEASTSASGAATSATNAATSATEAAATVTTVEAAKVAALAAQAAAETAETNAETAETNASTSATSASGSATAASTSATAAATSATNASTSESGASTSASTATTKASEAATSATNAATSESGASTSASTATTKASEAATSATAASGSASTATTKASEASTSASNAATSATAAQTAETNAETAETNAAASSSSASTSASTATTKASEASTSATNAATSASTATTKASEASTSATGAATSASTATTKASEASASETAAATSETNASTSSTNAAASATTATTKAAESLASANSSATSATASEAAKDAALAALDSFDDRYLGAKASDPTVDNDGNALVSGALYFNTTDDVMKVYTGSAWVAAYASLTGALLVANNLSDLNNVGAARTNLGLSIGTDVQAFSTVLSATTQPYTTSLNTKLNGIEAGATTDQTASEILTAIKTVDGPGSGLDADLLDGNHSSAFATAAQGTLADSAVQPNDSPTFGNITVTGTVDGRDIAADGTKLDGVEASADVTDTTNVTAAGALMDSEVTNLAQVKAFDSTDYATAAQGTTADAALPKAGGTMTGDLNFGDNDKAVFGAGSDLQIYHDGTSSLISDQGNGPLLLRATDFQMTNAAGSQYIMQGVDGGAVTLYHAGSGKLATTSTGVNVTGNVSATGGIYADTLMQIDNTTGFGKIEVGGASGAFIDLKTPASDDYDGRIYYDGSQLYITAANNQPTQLRHDNNTKLGTTSTGISVTGNIAVTGTVDGRDIATNIPASLGTAGQVLTVNSGATAGEWADAAGGGGGGLEYTTADTNLAAGGQYLLNITSNVTLTLPASPTTGDIIRIVAANGIDDGYTLTVARNGATISSLSEDLSVDTHGVDFIMWYNGTTWSLI